eukprot:scaffold1771_cov343-Pavlova_lutheri.AAC.3
MGARPRTGRSFPDLVSFATTESPPVAVFPSCQRPFDVCLHFLLVIYECVGRNCTRSHEHCVLPGSCNRARAGSLPVSPPSFHPSWVRRRGTGSWDLTRDSYAFPLPRSSSFVLVRSATHFWSGAVFSRS